MRQLKFISWIFVFAGLGGSAFASINQDQKAANDWAIRESKKFFGDCSKLTRQEVFKHLSRFKEQFGDEVETFPLASINSLRPSSPFIELGKVMFPEYLPRTYPMRGAYLICTDSYDEFKLAAKKEDRKYKLQELEDCFDVAYRNEQPETVKKLISCFKSMKDN